MINVLITGSNGFIGKNVCKFLHKKNIYLIGLGRKKLSSTNYINEYIQCDLMKDNVEHCLSTLEVKVDYIVHLAADMRKEPYCVDVINANCCGTQKLIEYAEKNNVKGFIELSSLPVIGKPLMHPIYENHPLHPYTIYHITKVFEEMLSEYAYEYKGLRTASFRISAPIGPYMNEKTIFSTFVRNALNNEDMFLYGKGTRKQNYIHVDDIAQAIYKALFNEKCHGVYNLTGDILISNYDLAIKIKKYLNSKSKVLFKESIDPLDDYVWDASIDKIKNDIDYNPMISLEEAIDDYAKFIK